MISVVAVVGPTATGKSALAMDLAKHFNGEIINADALQVYRGLNIGTAKPSLEDRAQISHHLIDILDPSEGFSAGAFARKAAAAILDISDRGRLPLVVGGSGFYLKALFEGLSPVPSIPQDLRLELRRRADLEGLAALRAELGAVDPEAVQRLEPGDTQRILRALEVWTATGRTLSSWLEEPAESAPFRPHKIGLTLPRSLLYDRIADRVRAMLEEGWLQEVEELLESGLSGSEPGFQAIGYRQLVRHLLDNRPDLPKVAAEIVTATRRYAKRQLTWFKGKEDIFWFLADDSSRLAREVIRTLNQELPAGKDS